jgi:hypothetical protein
MGDTGVEPVKPLVCKTSALPIELIALMKFIIGVMSAYRQASVQPLGFIDACIFLYCAEYMLNITGAIYRKVSNAIK